MMKNGEGKRLIEKLIIIEEFFFKAKIIEIVWGNPRLKPERLRQQRLKEASKLLTKNNVLLSKKLTSSNTSRLKSLLVRNKMKIKWLFHWILYSSISLYVSNLEGFCSIENRTLERGVICRCLIESSQCLTLGRKQTGCFQEGERLKKMSCCGLSGWEFFFNGKYY